MARGESPLVLTARDTRSGSGRERAAPRLTFNNSGQKPLVPGAENNGALEGRQSLARGESPWLNRVTGMVKTGDLASEL